MGDNLKLVIDGEKKEYPVGTTLLKIAKDFQQNYKEDIVLAIVNSKLSELHNIIKQECNIEFLTTSTKCGNEAYRRTATLMMLKAFNDVCGNKNIDRIVVDYSLSKGFFCTIKGNVTLNQELIDRVNTHMRELVDEDIPIRKRTLNTDRAIELFNRHRMYDKERLFAFRRSSRVNLYSLNGFEDYYYGYMLPSTGYIKQFGIYLYDDGFVIQLPVKESPNVLPPFEPQQKLYNVLKESSKWSSMLEVDTVGALNHQITKGNINDIILVQEALQEKKIADIARMISERPECRFIMIAGPSSSGKTSFSHRLSIQLRANGLKPHPIGVDDYFIDREFTPRDEKGNYNFEILEALDVEQFNKDMTDLMLGKEVNMPSYNFVTGKREYNGNKLQLGSDDILVIEGIHGLNDKLSYSLPKESKFKIYISALTQLNIDEHNRIPTTDGRLIRRMVRDARTRGTSAEDTIKRWASVRRGEDNYIFPFQEEADVMFNSSLIYELSVLKQYAEPILFGIPKTSPEYMEAKRLLKFLDYFLGVSSENIPHNSLLREFVGGSCFRV